MCFIIGRKGKVQNQASYSEILAGKRQLGPYPMEMLKRVDKPTTKITDSIKRSDEREHGFGQAYLGKLGPLPQK